MASDNDTNTITRTAALPLGFTATFSWSRASGLQTEWAPEAPRIHSHHHWRRFFAAYQDARREFMRDVATAIGGAVGIADLTGEFEVVQPATRH
jgi:hypothetical protein